jgi:hypothetical protein
MDKKRILLIILFIITTILLGYALYRVFFAKDKGATPGGTETEYTTGEFPTSGEGQPGTQGGTDIDTNLPISDTSFDIIEDDFPEDDISPPLVEQITEQPISNIGTNNAGEAKFYNKADGKFYVIGKNGEPEELSDNTFFNVSNVEWSPAKEEAIIEYPDGANIYYNFDTKKQVTLPRHWEEFSFDKTGNQIAAKSIGFSVENNWLIVSSPEGNDVSLVEPLGQKANKLITDWSPNGQVLALSRTGEPLGSDRQEVLLIGQYGENFKSIIVEGRDLRAEWSPTGEKLLHSVYSARSGYIPELWVVNASDDAIGSGRKLLGVNTWADKCAFADDRYVYCGIPTSIEKGAGFVPALADNTPDELLRIDTQTGLKQAIQTDGINTIDSIFIGDNGETLYFTDKNKPGLFTVSL